MADKLADGNLGQIIIEGREQGKPFDAIARELYAAHGIEVTRQTLANWARSLADADSPAAS
jgi:hypothetical protein